MNIHSKKIKVFILTILFFLSVLCMGSVLHLRTTMPGSFLPPHRIFDGKVYSIDFVYVGDVWVLTYVRNGAIHVLTSPDGENWSEIASPQADRITVSLLRDLNLVKDSERLGIVWVDRTPENEPWGSIFFLSMFDFDSRTWSEPYTLFQRKEGSFLNDALLFDGTLLLMWEESVTKYIQNEERTRETTSSYTAYRAVVYDETVSIEELIEPDRPSFYFTEGASFVQDDKGYIQCIFHYHNGSNSFFKSESTDGRTWGPPEPFPLSGTGPREFIHLEEGEIGALRYGRKEIALERSKDWEKWEEDLLIGIDEYYDVPLAEDNDREEVRILGAAIAKDSDGVLWLAFRTEYGVYISHYSEALDKEQQETEKTIEMCSLIWNINFIIAGLLFFWMWKDSKGAAIPYIIYFILYVSFLGILYVALNSVL